MDNLTHILLGGTAAYALFGKKIGRFAWLAGGIAATIPDLDVFIRTGDVILDRILHRHFSHSLVLIPVIGLLAAAFLLPFKRARDNFRTVLLAAIIGVSTHGLLDAFTSYGTLLFWPFTGWRVSWDIIAVIDPIFTIVLLMGLIIAAKKRSEHIARVTLLLATLYLGFGFIQHERAQSAQQILAQSRGHIIERGRVMPQLGSLLVWRSIYEYDGRFYADGIRTPFFSATVARPNREGVLRVAAEDLRPLPIDDRTTLAFDRLNWFADGYVARTPDNPFFIGDMRYSSELEGFQPLWGLVLENVEAPRWVNNTNRLRNDAIARLWRQMIYGEGYEPLPIPPSSAGKAQAAPK